MAVSLFGRILSKTGGIFISVLQYGCIAHCSLEFVADFVSCSGPSMEPTIHSSDIVLTEHISVTRQTIEVGDIVIARSPSKPNNFICKRVVGMAGDRVYNNCTYRSRLVPRGHVWLEGDNKNNSTDSRTYGPVPYALIRSRVFFRIWPPKDIGSVKFCPDEMN